MSTRARRVIPESIKAPAKSSPKPEPIASPASPSASSPSASSPKSPKQTLELTIATAILAYINENHKDIASLDSASLATVIKSLLPKRATKEKDPFAPTPARTALAHFGAEIRATPDFAKLKLGLKGTKHIADLWKALTAEQKAKYEALAKADAERFASEHAEYMESDDAKLFAKYVAKRKENLALLGFAEGVKVGKLPKDPRAPALATREALYLHSKVEDPKYVDQEDNTWIDGAKEKLKARWAKKTKEQKEEATRDEHAEDTKRFYAEYAEYTPGEAYIALVASSRIANPPVKPKTVLNKYIADYIADYSFEGDAKDKKSASAWKAKYTAQAKAQYKALTAKDASEDAKTELKKLKDAHTEAVGEWEEACAKFAKSHPNWVSPVKPKAKKGKSSPKVAKKGVKAVEEEVEDEEDEDAEVVEDESESEEESEEDDE